MQNAVLHGGKYWVIYFWGKRQINFYFDDLQILTEIDKNIGEQKGQQFPAKSWDTFKVSKSYQNLHLQFTEYAVRYEKEYLDYVKHSDINSIRAVNRKFP